MGACVSQKPDYKRSRAKPKLDRDAILEPFDSIDKIFKRANKPKRPEHSLDQTFDSYLPSDKALSGHTRTNANQEAEIHEIDEPSVGATNRLTSA